MVAGAADCEDVLPGEFGKRQSNYGVPGHVGWGMVPAVGIVAVQPTESSKAIL